MKTSRTDRIRERLQTALDPLSLEIDDESHLHVGHAGARDGKGHFRVKIVSAAFVGQSAIKRHRLVFSAVGDMLETDIHALSLDALAPGE